MTIYTDAYRRRITHEGYATLRQGIELCDELDHVHELLRRHVMDWGKCDDESCRCSHRQALDYFTEGQPNNG